MKIIGITGGKGGTGKSTISTSLAYELGKTKKVLLADMDVECPNDHLLLDINLSHIKDVDIRIPEWDFSKCSQSGLCGTVCRMNAIVSVKGKNPIFIPSQCNGCGACVIKCPSKAISWGKKEIGYIYSGEINSPESSISLLSGELKINESFSESIVDEMKKIVDKKKEDYDYIIIDTSAGMHCDVISALEFCDYAFAVTEPTPLGAHDLKLILKLLDILSIPKDIILNRSDVGQIDLIKDLSQKYNTRIISEIPYSREIIESYSRGIPVSADEIKILAERIIEGEIFK